MARSFAEGLSGILQLDRQGSPAAIIGDAAQTGLQSFFQAKQQTQQSNDKFLNAYFKLRSEGNSPEQAEEKARQVTGARIGAFSTPEDEARFRKEAGIKKQTLLDEKRLRESQIDLNKAKAEKARKDPVATTKASPKIFDTIEEAESFLGDRKGSIKIFKDDEGNEVFGVASIGKKDLSDSQKNLRDIMGQLQGVKTQKEAAERMRVLAEGQAKGGVDVEDILNSMSPEDQRQLQDFIANLEESPEEASIIGRTIQAFQPGEQKKIGGVVFEKGPDGKFRIRN
jgi:hypothetical protein